MFLLLWVAECESEGEWIGDKRRHMVHTRRLVAA